MKSIENQTILTNETPKKKFSKIKLDEILHGQKKVGNSEWIEGGETAESFGKLFRTTEGNSKKLVIYVGGFPGGGGINDFEQRVVPNLLKEGHDVFVARHPGTVLKSDKADVIVGSDQKIRQGLENGEDHLGGKDKYSMDDISLEAYSALKNLGNEYEQVDIVGHSFGSLGMLYSAIKIEEEDKELSKKIKSLTSFSGFIAPLKGEKGIIDKHSVIEPEGVTIGFFGAEIKSAVENGRYRLGSPEEELENVKKISSYIYDKGNNLSKNMPVRLVSARNDGAFTPFSTTEFAREKARDTYELFVDYTQGRGQDGELGVKNPAIHAFKDFDPTILTKIILGNIPEQIKDKATLNKKFIRINPDNIEDWKK